MQGRTWRRRGARTRGALRGGTAWPAVRYRAWLEAAGFCVIARMPMPQTTDLRPLPAKAFARHVRANAAAGASTGRTARAAADA